LRQSFGSFLTNSGTLMMRRHSGQGSRLPAKSAENWMGSSQKGQFSSMFLTSTGSSIFGSSANRAAAAASTSAGRGGGGAGVSA
jgi:hypothetical protein